MSFYKLIQGDCLKVTIPPRSIDCIVTDPPYGIAYHSNRYTKGNPHPKIIHDKYDCYNFIPYCFKALKNDAPFFAFGRMGVFPSILTQFGEHYKNTLVWIKNNWTAGDLTSNFGNQYEIIVYGSRGRPTFRTKRFSNVLYCDKLPSTSLLHPTQKPTSLIMKLIKYFTDEGDIVFDPFLGSGTTMEACQNLNRSCIGIEISPKYCEIVKKRCFGRTFLDREVEYRFEVAT